MSSLKTKIQEDRKDAMRAQDKLRLSTLQLILAAIKQQEVDTRAEVDDAHLIAILDKMAKQRRESISQFEAGNRPDLVAQETQELTLIQSYLPQPLSIAELDALIAQVMAETQAKTMQDMGKAMALLKPLIQGRADGALVGKKVKEYLSP
jgi:uncharacterized protein